MIQPPTDVLQRIEALLRAGKQQEARMLLMEYLKSNLTSARAWWLMSQAVTDINQQMDCLQRVLQLEPGNAQARTRLEELKAAASRPKAPTPAVFVDEPNPPVTKTTSGSASAASSPTAPPAVSPQPIPAKGAAPAVATPSAQGNQVPTPAGKPKKRLWIWDVLMAAVLIAIIAIAVIYLLQQQKTQADEARKNSLLETQAVALLLTKLPTFTSSPTLTPSSTPTYTSTATFTETPSLTPTLEFTLTGTPTLTGQVRPATGYLAPDFNLVELATGQKVTLSQFIGQPVLLFFWTTWCPDCRGEIPALISLQQNYADQGLVILAIDLSEGKSLVKDYQSNNHLTYRILLDLNAATQAKYKVNAIPTHFFVDSTGRITYIQVGSMAYYNLESHVQAILPP